MGNNIKKISISKIKRDTDLQPREYLSSEISSEYAEAMRLGAELPPITVFHDGENYWLADGWHRITACESIGHKDIYCSVRDGGKREAILFCVGSNDTHGLRRTNADKRRCVQKLLDDEEWSKWSDREIGRRCIVSDKTVARIREEMTPVTAEIRSEGKASRTYTTKHGTTAVMKVENISSTPRVKDPLDTIPQIPNHLPEDDDSDVLYRLKQYWKKSTKNDRKEFLKWINNN